MSRRLDVIEAVKMLIAVALPHAAVIGLEGKEVAPARISTAGRVIVRAGDPGEPEIDLSPLAYNWRHRIPIEVTGEDEASVDAMLIAIGAAVEVNRTLGGLCEWLDAGAAQTDDIQADNARPARGGDLVLTASYSTSNPLD